MVHGISRFLRRCVRHMQLIGDLRSRNSRNIGCQATHIFLKCLIFAIEKYLKKINVFFLKLNILIKIKKIIHAVSYSYKLY